MSVNRPPSATSCPHRAAPSTQSRLPLSTTNALLFPKRAAGTNHQKARTPCRGRGTPSLGHTGACPTLLAHLSSKKPADTLRLTSKFGFISLRWRPSHRGEAALTPHPCTTPRIFLLLSHTHSQWCRPGTCGMGPLFLGNCITCSLH